MMKIMVEYNTIESHWITGDDGKICLALEQTTTDTGTYLNPKLLILKEANFFTDEISIDLNLKQSRNLEYYFNKLIHNYKQLKDNKNALAIIDPNSKMKYYVINHIHKFK